MLSLSGVSKEFPITNWNLFAKREAVRALDDVSFEVRAGSVTALLGPNGAGKTTLIKIICGLILADRGTAKIGTVESGTAEGKSKTGLVTADDRSFFWRLNGQRNLEFFASLYDLSTSEASARIEELLSEFGLEGHAHRLIRTYSTGMKKRLALARAFMHDPDLLLMDESTNGLDAQGTEDLINLVRAKAEKGNKAVVWATHRFEEVSQLCDQVVVLINGRARVFPSIVELEKSGIGTKGYRIWVNPSQKHRLRAYASQMGPGTTLSEGGNVINFEADQDGLAKTLRLLLDEGITPNRVEPVRTLSQLLSDLAIESAVTNNES